MDADLRRLLDRADIVDLTIRYCTALDTKDWGLLASCFTDDAEAIYDQPQGPKDGPYVGPDSIVMRLSTSMNQLTASQHLVSNHVVALSSAATARSVCYVRAQHVRAGPGGPEQFMVGGTYTDDMLRCDDGWRIRTRLMSYIWMDPGWSPSGTVTARPNS